MKSFAIRRFVTVEPVRIVSGFSGDSLTRGGVDNICSIDVITTLHFGTPDGTRDLILLVSQT
jgi:hypothetical protein